MNNNGIELLEYNKIKEDLSSYALSDIAKKRVNELSPITDKDTIESWLRETAEARSIINRSSSIPIHSLMNIENIINKLGKGYNLLPEELTGILGLLREGSKLKRFMEDKSDLAPKISSYALSISSLKDLEEEIDRCIQGDRIQDKASNELARIRKKIAILEDRIKGKLDSVLKNTAYKKYIQENLVSLRNGRYVIPIKSEYRKNIEGNILDSSSSGSTVFIEPIEVKRIQDELNLLRIDEENEEYRILASLTAMVEEYKREVSINIETMAHYDFLFAKAKYSKSIDGSNVILNKENIINIKNGRHPLLGKTAVPLNFSIGEKYRSLVITGPNTGGKTVALKTVGLLTMMVQSGLQVPVEDGSQFAIFYDILVDIGDGQSIEQSLSTFSSHIKNIINILDCADKYSLVIVDELGAGTDPGEGMGIAVSVLEELYTKRATTIATTHYSEIKDFAKDHQGFENGCMEFDVNTLKPTYRLKIGIPGESNAFLIALRLGMNKSIIERAHYVTYKETINYENIRFEANEKTKKHEESLKEHDLIIEKQHGLEKRKTKLEKVNKESSFKLGDCVYISTMNRTGIVCELENGKGEIGVMVMKKKFKINKKRLKIYIESKELYPDEYDFDIVFESKENRKKDKLMSKRHVEGVTIEKNN